MCSIVSAFVDRLKELFRMHAIVELEADLIAVCAERTAQLLRRAEQCEKEGASAMAEQLRRLAEMFAATPLGSILTITAPLQAVQTESGNGDAQSEPPIAASSEAPAMLATTRPQIVIDFNLAVGRHFRCVLGPLARSRVLRAFQGSPHGRLAIVP